MRAQQLKLSQAERETRRLKMEEDSVSLAAKQKEDKKRAATEAK